MAVTIVGKEEEEDWSEEDWSEEDWSEEDWSEEEEDVEKALERKKRGRDGSGVMRDSKARRVGMRLSRKLKEDVVARLATVSSLQMDSVRRRRREEERRKGREGTSRGEESEKELGVLRTAVRMAEAAFATCRREYTVYQRSLQHVYAPRELAEERRRRDDLKRDIELAAEKLQDAKFTLSKEDERRRRVDAANRRRRTTTAPSVRIVHPRDDDDDDIAGANGTYMSTPQLIARAKTVMRRDTLALKRGVVMVEEMKSIGAATAAELHRQASVMRAVDGVVDDASHDLKTAGRAITYLMRGVHFDRCQKLMLALCLLGLAAVVMIAASKWSTSAYDERAPSTLSWTAHEALSSSGHVSVAADSVVDAATTDGATL